MVSTTCSKLACLALVLALVLGSGTLAYGLFLKAEADPAVPVPVAPEKLDPAKVMGSQACLDCHKPAIAAWQLTKHATGLDMIRQSPNAKTYATALGIPQDEIARNSLCVHCHGMKAEGTTIKSITGVSCESCHGASGGETGWLNPHSSYGSKDTTRDMETPEHLKERFATCDKAGMIRPGREYYIVRVCFQCHTVPYENLVNKTAHQASTGGFEVVSWIQGEVCHNMFLDPKKNAEAPTLWMARSKNNTPANRKRILYVLGQMVDMETSLRNLANASAENAYAEAMASRARSAGSNVDCIVGIVTLPEVAKVDKAFKKIRIKLRPSNKEEILKVADEISEAAQTFAKNHDGSKLGDLDQLIPPVGKGTRYKPPAN